MECLSKMAANKQEHVNGCLVCTDFHSLTWNVLGYVILDLTALMESLNVWYFLGTYLPFILPGELGFELLLALLTVSIRDDLVWDCLPADESGLLTAPRTLVVLGWNEKCMSLSIWLKPREIYTWRTINLCQSIYIQIICTNMPILKQSKNYKLNITWIKCKTI